MTDDLKKPMFSVVIPLYNKANQVRKTLQSVLAQTFTDYEIVIVDDGSTDGSQDVVKNWIEEKKSQDIQPPTIRLVSQQNAGVSAARNKGISESRGKYIALLDADDEWKPEYLATQTDLIKRYPECEVFATNYEFKNDKGLISPTILRNIKFNTQDGVLDNYFEVASCSHPPLWTSAVCVSKKAIELIGGFPVGIKSGEDLLTWARLACRYKIAYSLKTLAVFNVEGYNRNEKPKRIPSENDIVDAELNKLKKEFKSNHINCYISFWHKMRGVIYWRLNMRKKSIKEALKSIRYNPLNYKAYALFIVNMIPKNNDQHNSKQ